MPNTTAQHTPSALDLNRCRSTRKADALIIACAERDRLRELNAELLAALREIEAGCIGHPPTHANAGENRTKAEIRQIARAAIAKATGGES